MQILSGRNTDDNETRLHLRSQSYIVLPKFHRHIDAKILTYAQKLKVLVSNSIFQQKSMKYSKRCKRLTSLKFCLAVTIVHVR